MRPVLKLALIALLMAAAPAASQQPAPPLRAASPAKPPTEPPPAPPTPYSPAPPAAPAQSPLQTADQCRTACAQDYYFCLASDTPDDCPAAWGQCRLACNAAFGRSR